MSEIRIPTVDDPLRILSLGAGVQSSYLFLASCLGELPRLDVAIFADTQYEPAEVYTHLDWLEEVGREHGIPIIRCTVGNLRADAVDKVKHRACIPLFIKNRDGSKGIMPRQCTRSYKIDPMNRWVREHMLGIAHGQRAPREAVVEQWIGISFDEARRCAFPGVWTKVKRKGVDLFGHPYVTAEEKRWRPLRWKTHAYPLCDRRYTADRKIADLGYQPIMDRTGCLVWLKRKFPGRKIPRSACIGCPYRSNHEWRLMRDTDPVSWADAVRFDREIREADATGQSKRKMLVGLPFVHDSLVPLDMVDLSVEDGKRGAGCGIVTDLGGAPDDGLFAGMCGV